MRNHRTKEKSRKHQLVKYGRRITRAGFVVGSGGNISVRDQDVVFLKAKNIDMSKAGENDYVVIDLKTRKSPHQSIDCRSKPKGKPLYLSSEYQMHILCYQQRPDICAVIHTHPTFCVALSPKIKVLYSEDYEFLANIGGSIQVIPYIQPGTLKLAQVVSKVIKRDDAVILKNHGLVCVGKNLEEAFLRCQVIERASLIYILRKGLE